MDTRSLGPILRYLKQIARVPDADQLTDRQLLGRFVEHGDEDAFATLVQRHGSLILDVCRRVLRQAQDAEDVFQATFLVLARKAASIGWRESVGPWLYEVASRLALEARRSLARRQAFEKQLKNQRAEPAASEVSWQEFCSVLDEELLRLPEKFRLPLLLCLVQGKARDEAARQLGWTLGKVKGRLERGRELLRSRLARRGVSLSAVLAGALLPGPAQTAVTDVLLRSTVQAAVAYAGKKAVAAVVPTAAANLAGKTLAAMGWGPLKLFMVVMAAVVALAGAGWFILGVAHPHRIAPTQQNGRQKLAEPGKRDNRRKNSPSSRAAILPERVHGEPLRHNAMVRSVAFSPDGKRLATSSFDRTVRLWQVATGTEARVLRSGDPENSAIAFSPDGTHLVSASSNHFLYLWNLATGKRVRRIDVGQGHVYAVAFSPDGKVVASAGQDRLIRLWDAATGQLLHELRGHEGRIWTVAFAPDGKTLASGCEDRSVRLWRVATGKEVDCLRGHSDQVTAVQFSPDGQLLASACFDSTVRLWDVAGKQTIRQLAAKGERLQALAFSPSGHNLALATNTGAIQLWEVVSGKRIRHYRAHQGAAYSVAFSPDGRTLASGGEDGMARFHCVTGLGKVGRFRIRLTPEALEELWDDLAGTDAREAHEAIWILVAASADSIPLLATKLPFPGAAADLRRAHQLVADLDSNRYAIRQKAAVDLETLGRSAILALRRVLQGRPSLEVRRRAQGLLKKLLGQDPSPNVLRTLRAFEVLEAAASREAQAVLQKLAAGSPETWQSVDAAAPLARLTRRLENAP
jgi:RNA polymerase sigma factor (sigma-70 family)